jgi:hypothetical protein
MPPPIRRSKKDLAIGSKPHKCDEIFLYLCKNIKIMQTAALLRDKKK